MYTISKSDHRVDPRARLDNPPRDPDYKDIKQVEKPMMSAQINPLPADVAAFLQAHPDIESVDLMIPDMNGILRGKRISVHALGKVYQDGVNLPGSIFAADITGDTVEATGLGFEIGDADQVCRPIPGSLCHAPWHTRPTGQLLMGMYDEQGHPYFADPRHILKQVVNRFSNELKLTPVVAIELEFYLIDSARTQDGGLMSPKPLSGSERMKLSQVYGLAELDEYGDFFEAVESFCQVQGIPTGGLVAEYAPGQYEINLQHQSDPLLACDHAVMLKRVIRSTAQHFGMHATFMAKPYADLPGSGAHVHISLNNHEGCNVFGQRDGMGQELLHHALGGLIETMSEAMAFYAPNVNSFRRFQESSFVPLAPAWSYNNRTTALRIPSSPDYARRLEHRVGGADANPYLLTAAILAGIHHGITEQCTPNEPITGNAYLQLEPSLPMDWLDALRSLEQARVLPTYLGTDFLDVYLASKHAERDKFHHHVSPLEHDWYLHTV